MKNLIFLSIAVLLITCANSTENKTLIPNSTNNNEPTPQIDIAGIWYYSNYIDSTIIYKKIYDYSWSIASFGYKIIINNTDSLIFHGYHEGAILPIHEISDNKYRVGINEQQYWILNFTRHNGISKLEVQEHQNALTRQQIDTNIYTFYKKNIDIDNEELYFAKSIIAGQYYDSINNDTIHFKDNLDVIGFKDFNHYTIQIDPWDMVPQMDIITLTNTTNKHKISYNWHFEDNAFILSSLITLYYDEDGNVVEECQYCDYAGAKINKIEYRLKKIE
ncbi:MAG: hypothetical protein LBM72_01105 [Mycoplasmataceae bacterium]|jgi:hypothetical protein|nr:hypothetical protein [Mycoplasmataceae bacterium]